MIVPAGHRFLLVGSFCLALCPAAQAVIFYSTADPTYNTTAPTGPLAGWQWVGNWGGYQGTPIGANYFITARHVGGTIGNPFILNGVTYTTNAFFDDTVTDLRICRINGTFPSWAPLYRGSGEVGSSLVVFGQGLSRGSAVTVGSNLAGWQWGAGGGTLRWGQNTVNSVVDGGSYWGQLLYATFNAGAGANECHLADGDSGGPVFIYDGLEWALAGIAAAVDGPFNTTDNGDGFEAALFDARGLYMGGAGNWQLITGPGPVPSGVYATQISVRASWIDSIVPQSVEGDTPLFDLPEMAVLAVLFFGAGAFLLRKQGRSST